MPLTAAFGRVTLGPTGAEVTFTTDPDPYEPYQWEKRMSAHKGIGGAVTIQDFGVFKKDLILNLRGSPTTSWMDNDLVKTVDGFYRVVKGLFHYTDWLGNDFTVFIESFTFSPHVQVNVSSYELRLHVLGITTLLGSAYTGT